MAIDEEEIRTLRAQVQTLEEKLDAMRRSIESKLDEIKYDIRNNT